MFFWNTICHLMEKGKLIQAKKWWHPPPKLQSMWFVERSYVVRFEIIRNLRKKSCFIWNKVRQIVFQQFLWIRMFSVFGQLSTDLPFFLFISSDTFESKNDKATFSGVKYYKWFLNLSFSALETNFFHIRMHLVWNSSPDSIAFVHLNQNLM